MTPLRIGIWFDISHLAYGGPTSVLLGTILGLFQDAETRGLPIVILLNERGDVNWGPYPPNPSQDVLRAPNMLAGPCIFSTSDADVSDLATNKIWNTYKRVVFPSEWFAAFVSVGLPYANPQLAGHRKHYVWGAGVNTDYFKPSSAPKTQDFFIYFKSQNFNDLNKLYLYLFTNYFKLRGTVVSYYYYDPAMLLQACHNSKFCIMLDRTETQGLAALEIMATGCPLFVLDAKTFIGKKFTIHGATSVTCWDQACGIKSSMENMEKDFPYFVENYSSFKPREFVLQNYSYSAAARNFRELLSREETS